MEGDNFGLEIDLDEKKNRSMIVQRRRTSPTGHEQYIMTDNLQDMAVDVSGNVKKLGNTKRKLKEG